MSPVSASSPSSYLPCGRALLTRIAASPTPSSSSAQTSRRSALLSLSLVTSLTSLTSLLPLSALAEQCNADGTQCNAYLTEPTAEFKASEAQRAEFRKAQLKVKGDFTAVLTKFVTRTNQSDIANDLKDIQFLVTRTGGLPLGIKYEDLTKIVRRKKAEKWSTECEIAYQALCTEIR